MKWIAVVFVETGSTDPSVAMQEVEDALKGEGKVFAGNVQEIRPFDVKDALGTMPVEVKEGDLWWTR